VEKHINFLKTTLLGGLVFLLPLILLIFVVGQGVQIAFSVIQPLNQVLPLETHLGKVLFYAAALSMLLFVCFLAGIAARSLFGKRLFHAIDEKLLAFPGYALFKVRLTGNIGDDLKKCVFAPVLVDLDMKMQIGFAVEDVSRDRTAIFLPGAPDPWSGSIIFVDKKRVQPLKRDMREVMQIFENLGKESSKIIGD